MPESLRAKDVLGIGLGFRDLRCSCGRSLVKTRRVTGEIETYCRLCRSEIIWLLREGYEPEVVRTTVRARKVLDLG